MELNNTQFLSNRMFQFNFIVTKVTWTFNESGNEVNIKGGLLDVDIINSNIGVKSLGGGEYIAMNFIKQKFVLYGNKIKTGPVTLDEITPQSTSSNANQIQTSATQNDINPNDVPDTVLNIVSVFFPIAGLIIYLTEKEKAPKKAISAGKSALLGLGIYVGFNVIFFIFYFIFYIVTLIILDGFF